MGRRLLIGFAVVPALFCTAAATAGTSKPAQSWAAPQIKLVTAAGLFDASTAASFRPDDGLTAQALEDLSFELKQRLTDAEPTTEPLIPTDPTTTTITTPTTTTTATTDGTTTTAPSVTTTPTVTIPAAPKQVANPTKPVTMAQLDQRLVQTLGLGKAATEFAHGAKYAGFTVPARFGSEVVARLLGLRLNHPAAQDSLELLPGSAATRAEAAYSTAEILSFHGWEIQAVQQLADTFALPSDLTDWQKTILTTAFARIGMPYIWGGTSDGAETEFGVLSRGGYDCSGFVWRVYKLQSYPNEGALTSVLRGRTTYQMSGEVPKSKRIAIADLEPADVIFFGDKGPKSQPSQVGHMGIYIGNGWFIHSSEYGVALAQLTGWYATKFAWARRPLAEAGLESS
jgi:cell wall-associated NlpC family hydrolase